MKRLRCCCPTIAYNPTAADQQRHLLEAHGIVPARAPQVGDVVYPLPEHADPTWYVVARVRSAVRCRGCQMLLEKNALNASQQWNPTHYCLSCANFSGGTPEARAERIRRFHMNHAA